MSLRKGSHGAGTWSLPGGHVELGEEPRNTALRELVEELGPQQCQYGPVEILEHYPYASTIFKEGKHHITLFFETELIKGEPIVMEPDKCERWEWADAIHPPRPLFGNLDKISLQLWARFL